MKVRFLKSNTATITDPNENINQNNHISGDIDISFRNICNYINSNKYSQYVCGTVDKTTITSSNRNRNSNRNRDNNYYNNKNINGNSNSNKINVNNYGNKNNMLSQRVCNSSMY